MSGHTDPTIQRIIALHAEENYNAIIDIFRDAAFDSNKSSVSNLHLVTWPLPSEKDLKKFAQFVKSHKIHRIFSIGCGTGLLEWLMLKYIQKEAERRNCDLSKSDNICTNANANGADVDADVELIGVEVDSRWWNSSYCPPKFIPLLYYDEDFDPKLTFGGGSDMAIFCYFNNIHIFNNYLRNFQGQFVVLIGPISTEQYCAPGPKDLAENSQELPTKDWVMLSCEQFGFISIDHLAIYGRKSSQI